MTTLARRADAVRDAIAERLARFPGHPQFLFAARQHDPHRPRRAFHDGLTIDVMPAREPEAADPSFRACAYDLLEEVGRVADDRARQAP